MDTCDSEEFINLPAEQPVAFLTLTIFCPVVTPLLHHSESFGGETTLSPAVTQVLLTSDNPALICKTAKRICDNDSKFRTPHKKLSSHVVAAVVATSLLYFTRTLNRYTPPKTEACQPLIHSRLCVLRSNYERMTPTLSEETTMRCYIELFGVQPNTG